MKELAERLDADTDKLIERWSGRPDLAIEDIFQVRDLETKEVSNLDLTNYQRQFVHAYWYGDASTINVLKGRRTGYSFIACAAITLDALTTPHGFFAITGPSKSQAKDRIEDIYDLIEWARIDIDLEVDNRDEIQLFNSATIMAFSGNPDTSRGADSADTLYIDEMAFLEDQEESMRAFSPFVALGDAQTVEVSTPNRKNDIFMEDQRRGSPGGENGIISIYQPAFKNPDEIDVNKPLFEQDAEPVMPYLDLEEAEKDRARDPKGFKQEYLCEPVEDEYRFFDEETIDRAVKIGSRDDYKYGYGVGPQRDGKMVMGVDIAGGGKDDTAVTVVEHAGKKRYLRYHEIITDDTLRQVGIEPAKARNPSAVAERIKQIYNANQVDRITTDATNMGEGFDSEIQQAIGRGINSFNFSDREAVDEMMKDLNYGLHNAQVGLIEHEKLRKQLLAIVKDKSNKGSTPRYSGKDHSPDGKDDLAIAFALAAYPPNINTEDYSLQEKESEPESDPPEVDVGGPNLEVNSLNESGFQGAVHRRGRKTGRSNSQQRTYEQRHERRRRR